MEKNNNKMFTFFMYPKPKEYALNCLSPQGSSRQLKLTYLLRMYFVQKLEPGVGSGPPLGTSSVLGWVYNVCIYWASGV